MSLKLLITILSIAFAVAVISIIVAYLFFKKKENNKKTSIIIKQSKMKNSTNHFYLKAYNRTFKFKLARRLLLRLRRRVETLGVYDDADVRRQVMKLVFQALAVVAAVLILLIFTRPGWLMTFWVFVGLMFLSGLLIDRFINQTEMKLLHQLKYYNSRIRHYYQQSKMIDEASYEAIADVGAEMKIQATRIHNILMSDNPDEERAKYDEVAPTRFLKVLASLMVMVKDKGDKIDPERGSAFTRGVSAISQELNTEIMYRSKIAYRLRFLAGMAIMPIFLTLPIQNAISNMFPILQRFYESRTGLISLVVIYAASIFFYFLARKLKDVSELRYIAKENDKRIEKKLFEKVPFLERVMIALGPKYGTKKYAKRFQLLKDANSAPHVSWLTLRQVGLAVATVVVLIVILIFGHQREAQSALYSVLPDSMASGNIKEDEYEEYLARNELDRQMVEDMQKLKFTNETEIKLSLMNHFGVDEIDNTKVTTAYNRILNKYYTVENAYLKYWEVLLVLLAAVLIWHMPIVLLIYQRGMRLKDMENEVHQFLTIISILREFENVTVYVLLTWLENFSVTFKTELQVAIQNFDSGSEESLRTLSDNNNFDAFKQIVERMQLALTRLSVAEAFEDIEIEREYYAEQRREYNERSINNRVAVASITAFIPSLLLLLLYFVGPMLYMSIKEMSNFTGSL